MKRRHPPLTLDQVKETLSQELIIGTGHTHAGDHKRFTFNPQQNEYTITVAGKYHSGGQDIEALLNEYNEL